MCVQLLHSIPEGRQWYHVLHIWVFNSYKDSIVNMQLISVVRLATANVVGTWKLINTSSSSKFFETSFRWNLEHVVPVAKHTSRRINYQCTTSRNSGFPSHISTSHIHVWFFFSIGSSTGRTMERNSRRHKISSYVSAIIRSNWVQRTRRLFVPQRIHATGAILTYFMSSTTLPTDLSTYTPSVRLAEL